MSRQTKRTTTTTPSDAPPQKRSRTSTSIDSDDGDTDIEEIEPPPQDPKTIKKAKAAFEARYNTKKLSNEEILGMS